MPSATVTKSPTRRSTTRRAVRRNAGAKGKSPKLVYYFGSTKTEGRADQKLLLGGKGANLADMTSIGLPVPPGFTITTETCALYASGKRKLPKGLMEAVAANIRTLERELGKRFGSAKSPLLVSVRSGAAVSMPGMMDTILNLGLNDEVVEGLARSTNNPRFAYDAYRRLINMFGDVVMGVDHEHFEHAFGEVKSKHGTTEDTKVPVEGLRELCARYQAIYADHVGKAFPQDPMKQLEAAIGAVFESWNGARAIAYRQINGIKGLAGTAVNVQAMAYGNMGEDSGTGVAFTRDPSTGANEFYGEFLVNAQGEDVVAGIRTPQPISQMAQWNAKVWKQLLAVRKKLERHYRDMQDIEFTIEKGRLFMLQTRNGKRNGAAAVRCAVEMVREGLINEKTALRRVPAADLVQLLLPYYRAQDKHGIEVLTTGIAASPGAASGRLAFSAVEAVERTNAGERVLLVRKETSPEDVAGMHKAEGILTSTGGKTSHAAVVAVGWGKCCVVGAGELSIDASAGTLTVKGRTFGRHDTLSIDGTAGEVMPGEVARTLPEGITGDFSQLLKWADKHATMGVRANADTPADARVAREYGAIGIGLCRTEHMFFQSERIKAMRMMILANDAGEREAALARLLPYQRTDFIGIFTAMAGQPVTVRLLDPPLHEFVPHEEAQQQELANEVGVALADVKRRVAQLHEANPMLGHRGCRLAVTYPEILTMQVRAITEAAIECRSQRIDARPEIMIPLVGTRRELASLRVLTQQTIAAVFVERKVRKFEIPIGTMIEIPRAAVTADEVAEAAEFFSFGTNDLTQMTFGFSRDDIASFVPAYIAKGLLECDPFQSLDANGVGALVRMACEKGRATRPDIKLGVCGEHGGDPASIRFFQSCGLAYVSCSPFRVPVARLAAAQAALA